MSCFLTFYAEEKYITMGLISHGLKIKFENLSYSCLNYI